MLSPCSMQLRHVHAWHGYVDLWPPCERWLKGATGDACDLVNFKLAVFTCFHRCTMPKIMLQIKHVAFMVDSLIFSVSTRWRWYAMVCNGAVRIYKAAFKAICVAALAIAPSMMPGPLGPSGGAKTPSCGTVSFLSHGRGHARDPQGELRC